MEKNAVIQSWAQLKFPKLIIKILFIIQRQNKKEIR